MAATSGMSQLVSFLCKPFPLTLRCQWLPVPKAPFASSRLLQSTVHCSWRSISADRSQRSRVWSDSAAGGSKGVTMEQELAEKGNSYFINDSRPVILYDGVCNMCNGSVNFVLDRDKARLFRFAALQSEAGKALLVKSGRAPDFMESLVLVTEERSYEKSEAVLLIAKMLRLPLLDLALLAPLFVRDTVYDTVARNRYTVLGKRDSCRISDAEFGERFVE